MNISTQPKLGGKILVDPSPLASDLRNADYFVDHFWGKANSFTLPIGFNPGKGYVLMEVADYDTLVSSSTTYTLELLGGTGVQINKIVIEGMEVIDGSTVVTGKNVALVRISDVRSLGNLSSIDKAYNVQTPQFDGTKFYKRTLNGSTPWTWQDLIDDIWSYLPGVFGTLSTANASLPTTKPEGFDFQGWECWKALEQALAAIERTIQLNPNGTFEVVIPGNSGNADQFSALTGYLVDHGHNDRNNAINMPAKIRVFFPNKTYAWHTSTDLQENVGKSYWRNRPFKSIDITTGSPVAFPGTILNLHSSKYALYDNSESKTLTNESILNLEANKLAEDYVAIASRNELELTFSGYHSVLFNGEVTSVAWFDFGIEDGFPKGAFTSITRFPRSPRLDFTDNKGSTASSPLRYLSPEKYPGPADLATQHLDVEYIAVVRPRVNIPQLKSGVGDFLYGKSGSGVNDYTDWNISALPHYQTFHNFSQTNVALAENNYLAIWNQQRKKWIICADLTLVLLKAKDWMDVGSAVAVDTYTNNGGLWETPGVEAIAQDVSHRSFLTPGDLCWGYPIGATDDGTVVFEILGENGLHQWAKAISAVECGSEGSFEVQIGNPDKDPTSQDLAFSSGDPDEPKTGTEYLADRKPLAVNASCPTNYRQHSVNACISNKHRKVFAGEYVKLRYIVGNRKWEASPWPDTLFAKAKLATNMCPGDPASLTNILPIGMCNISGITIPNGTANNQTDLKLAGQGNYNAFVVYLGTGNSWYIINVQHIEQEVVEEIEVLGTCPTAIALHRKHAIMTCEEQAPEGLFSGVPVTVVAGITSDGCTASANRVTLCVFAIAAASDVPIIDASEEVDVVTDFRIDRDNPSGSGNGSCGITAIMGRVKVCSFTPGSFEIPVVTFESQVVMYNVVDTGDEILGCFVEIFTACIGDDWCDTIIETDPCTSSS